MANYNKVLLMGNLTRDPELRYLPSNMPVVQIGLAVNDRVKNRETDQWEDRPNFIDCTAFGKTAELLNQYLRKGRPVFIEGKLRWSSWEDKQSGQKRSKIDVVIESFQFVDSKGGGGGEGHDAHDGDFGSAGGASAPARGSSRSTGPSRSAPPPPPMDNPEDIPF